MADTVDIEPMSESALEQNERDKDAIAAMIGTRQFVLVYQDPKKHRIVGAIVGDLSLPHARQLLKDTFDMTAGIKEPMNG